MEAEVGFELRGHGPRNIAVVLTILAAIALLVPGFPLFAGPIPYVLVHSFVELLSISISAAIFALAFSVRNEPQAGALPSLAGVFLAVGLCDMLHVLSYPGMPAMITEASPEKAINFWLAARFFAIGGLAMLAFAPVLGWRLLRPVPGVLLGILASVGVWIAGTFFADQLPRTFIEGQGLTPFKIGTEYVLVAIAGATAYTFARRSRDPSGDDSDLLRWLAGGTWVLGLSEVFFTLYADVTDLANLFGHFYKAIGDGMIYAAIFLGAVRRPYEKLADALKGREAAQMRAHKLAFYDVLTGLPNRRLFQDRLDHALLHCRRRSEHGALLLVDLDNFKTLNDTQGHAVGDQLLIAVGARLAAAIRACDTVARLGGDEFVVLLSALSPDEQKAAAQAQLVGEKICRTLDAPFSITLAEGEGTWSHHSTASIGVSVFGPESASGELVMQRTDAAMYQAKDAGRNALRFFDPTMQADFVARLELIGELRAAIANQEFEPYYQVQVDQAGRVLGVEALVRWHHPTRGLQHPGLFIELAEEIGLIVEIGRHVLQAACEQLSAWASDARTEALTISVNVSPRQFRNPDFVDEVRQILADTGADPARLRLELTESLIIDNLEQTIERMDQLRSLGLTFSMDDFGTGYASLSSLQRLPLAEVKIDRSFVFGLPDSLDDAAIVRSTLDLARHLGLFAVAEGVETEEQRAFLEAAGCVCFQGYLFGRPQPIGLIEKQLLS